MHSDKRTAKSLDEVFAVPTAVTLCIAPPPDFLWNLVALGNFMRLSLQKGAPAASSSAAWQEIRVRGWSCKAEFYADSKAQIFLGSQGRAKVVPDTRITRDRRCCYPGKPRYKASPR
jgi:hypothetical protein